MNILIATHGRLAEGFKDALTVILGDSSGIETIGLMAGESIDKFGEQVLHCLNSFDHGKGTIVFTDILSASPFNQTLLAIRKLSEKDAKNIYVVSGVSLPMILEAVNHSMIGSKVEEIVTSLEAFVSTEDAIWYLDKTKSDDDDDF